MIDEYQVPSKRNIEINNRMHFSSICWQLNADDELKDNISEQKRQLGSRLQYGQIIQVRLHTAVNLSYVHIDSPW